MLRLQCWKNKVVYTGILASLLLLFSQVGLCADSSGYGAMYSSYLPFGSLYNSLTTENSITNYDSTTQGFKFASENVVHYAPGFAFTVVLAKQGVLGSIDLGIMGGAGSDNIIPNFPVRPFVSLNIAAKFVNTPILGAYITGGIYGDLAIGKGKNNYTFTHVLAFFRVGPGVSLKFTPLLEFFAQVQLAIGIQMESISLESKAGNPIYDGTFMMVPLAIFPEAGIRIWL